MAHIVTNNCSDCKFTDCVEVCPVACFYELDRQLVIHPDECIDCTACVSVCPVAAIFAEGDLPKQDEASIEFNATEAKRVKAEGKEAIVKQKDPLPTAAERRKALGH
jgi:ferredoxin